LFVFALSLKQYCKESFLRKRAGRGSVASTHKLIAGNVLKARDCTYSETAATTEHRRMNYVDHCTLYT